MTKTTETMGMRIRARRKALGFTQQYLAEILWVKEETISNYENDKVDIKGSIICKLAETLETTPDYLLTGSVMKLTEEEMEILDIIKSLNADVKMVALQQLKSLSLLK
ncbi:MAG: helix-turn-helix domain-containing protein [Lachnospiraceae bacterium]|nr:helix-turn-helix domain-containing protein [Lachnospiraceae bacterium]